MAAPKRTPVDAVLRLSVRCDGQLRDHALRHVHIERAVNRVPFARLDIDDGDMASGTLPVSDGDDYQPGAEVEILAGHGDDETLLFKGIVVKHGLRLAAGEPPLLRVECRDASTAMTIGRRSAHHAETTDSALIQDLIEAHGLTAEVTATDEEHPLLTQHHCSDWDFMLARAQAHGLLVTVRDGLVKVAPPSDDDPVLALDWADDLIALDAEIDARTQFAKVQATAWDAKTQAIVQGEVAKPAALPLAGDLDATTLAKVIGLDTLRLQAGAAISKASLGGWAKARQMQAALARTCGHFRMLGDARVDAGTWVTLQGIGARFSGPMLVTEVQHIFRSGEWLTQARFGLAAGDGPGAGLALATPAAHAPAPAAAGLLPGVPGLQVGVVLKLDEDPLGEHRIQVSVPVLEAEEEGIWARLLHPHATEEAGFHFLPEVGDEVVLGYLDGDPSHPVVLGSLHSSARAVPDAAEAENPLKSIVTRSKIRIDFDDEKKSITVSTPAGNQIVLSDDDESIALICQNGNQVTLGSDGIVMDSPKDISLSAKGKVVLDGTGGVTVSSQADVALSGLNVKAEAQVALTAKGSATAELSASGQTTVKGAIVMIN